MTASWLSLLYDRWSTEGEENCAAPLHLFSCVSGNVIGGSAGPSASTQVERARVTVDTKGRGDLMKPSMVVPLEKKCHVSALFTESVVWRGPCIFLITVFSKSQGRS